MLRPIGMNRLPRFLILLTVLGIGSYLLFLTPAQLAVAQQQIIHVVYITNVTDSSFTVSWTTDQASNGIVEWGTTTALGQTSTDPYSNLTTHYVVISGLYSTTTYYFQVRSGSTVDNNHGAFYQVTTGALLAPHNPGGFWYFGYMFQVGGTVPVPNAIVYLQIQSATTGNSQWVSTRTQNSGPPGIWSYNLHNARTADASDYFTFNTGDQVRIIWQGGVYGCIGESPNDIRLFTIPASSPVQQDMTLDANPTSVSLSSISAHQVPSSTTLLALVISLAFLAGIVGVAFLWRQPLLAFRK